ncbi:MULTISPECIES: isochorismate synthase [Luteimonas]|uniref:isochorismate synthase n=1 Tax=Luteimonas TaxID=83614 RepID=UPI000C7D763A|nr:MULTISPECIES: isochorismate synthase [Luteimonas]
MNHAASLLHELRDAGTQAPFRLHAPDRHLATEGVQARLPSGPAATLGARVAAFFAAPRSGPALLVGALPFDPRHDDALHQPVRLSPPASDPATPAAIGPLVATSEVPTAAAYADAVARCVAMLRDAPDGDADALRKVVLARGLRVEAAAPIDPQALALRLGADASVTTFVVPLPVAPGDAPAWLVGATPELLVSRRGRAVVSHPLAGSARRIGDPVEDRHRTDALLASGKDLHEHRLVVEAILDGLAPLCRELAAPPRPSLHATATMWHLATRITGTLKDADVSSATLAGVLHPTPAVCGTPRLAALQAIRAYEPFDRGFYAGAVGWTDAAGDGDWYVSIRCARVQGRTMHLYAGAGIVAGSQPESEVDETAAKFMALRNALGIDDAGAA